MARDFCHQGDEGIFVLSLSPSRQMYLKIDHDCFLPCPYYFVIYKPLVTQCYYAGCPATLLVLQDLIPEVIAGHKRHTNIGLILNSCGAVDVWNSRLFEPYVT
jgi:hypothetical protein